jgi:membrane-associated protease RseP (regulator of RpoE activity)
VPFVLFALTCLTTTATGALNRHPGSVFPLADGLAYSIPLMAILLSHELGHYIAARVHGVPASWPHFIPLPPGLGPLGTMGAVIAQESSADRRKLMDIGAAGPLAGLAVAIPVLIWGLRHSEVLPIVGGGLQEGDSILYASFKYWLKGERLPSDGRDVILHPTAFAGWAGLFVTMLNLIPIGQLDGGHVATAHFGNRHERTSRLLHLALPGLALVTYGWVYVVVSRELGGATVPEALSPSRVALAPVMQWLIWFGLLALMRRVTGGRYHPPIDDRQPLGGSRRAVFWLCAAVFVLTFMPVPIRLSVGVPAPDAPASPAPGAHP